MSSDKLTKVLFVHDGPLYKDSDKYYGIHFNDTLVSRYKHLGDHVTFMMRVYDIETKEGGRFSLIQSENFRVVSVPNFKSIRLYFKNKSTARKIVRETVREHDIIIARMPSAIGKLAIEEARHLNKPVLVEFVACTFDAYWNYGWKGKLIAHYKLLRQKGIIRNVPFIVYVTEKFLQSRYPSKGKQISCSNVELKTIDSSILDRRLSKISTTDFTQPLKLGTIASVDVPYKGQDDVIKALSILRKKGKIFHYVLIGQGDQSRLRKLITQYGVNDLVTILGPVKHDEIFGLIDQLDLYVHPSKTEGLPRAVIEAMSRACPVIGSSAGGTPELISESMVYDAGNVNRLVTLLDSVNKETLLTHAELNLKKASTYEKGKLYNKRHQFYLEFLQHHHLPVPRILKSIV